jgi:hypothetical protein
MPIGSAFVGRRRRHAAGAYQRATLLAFLSRGFISRRWKRWPQAVPVLLDAPAARETRRSGAPHPPAAPATQVADAIADLLTSRPPGAAVTADRCWRHDWDPAAADT